MDNDFGTVGQVDDELGNLGGMDDESDDSDTSAEESEGDEDVSRGESAVLLQWIFSIRNAVFAWLCICIYIYLC